MQKLFLIFFLTIRIKNKNIDLDWKMSKNITKGEQGFKS